MRLIAVTADQLNDDGFDATEFRVYLDGVPLPSAQSANEATGCVIVMTRDWRLETLRGEVRIECPSPELRTQLEERYRVDLTNGSTDPATN